jgi:hypothetical protein
MSYDFHGTIEAGMVFVARKSGTGRRWRAEKRIDRAARSEYDRLWLLEPMGPDVRPAQEGGKMNGGVRSIVRTQHEIHTRFRRVA